MPVWQQEWFDTGIRDATDVLWRGVEAQHRVATMKLVDTLDEQAELERILEDSKPPLRPRLPALSPESPPHDLHYLVQTPFRYRSPHASRFRRGGDPGLWYGARERETACTEVAYWRWRFLMDSAGLRDGELVTEHTLFQARAAGAAIDLMRKPWSAAGEHWTHPSDYAACHALAQAARAHGVQWIRYASVRRPGGHCAAVLTPQALTRVEPARMQTWICKVTAAQALMLHDEDRLTIPFAATT